MKIQILPDALGRGSMGIEQHEHPFVDFQSICDKIPEQDKFNKMVTLCEKIKMLL